MFRWLQMLAEARISLPCPVCGHFGDLVISHRAQAHSTYTVDCIACGRPSKVHLDTTMDAGGGVRISIEPIPLA